MSIACRCCVFRENAIGFNVLNYGTVMQKLSKTEKDRLQATGNAIAQKCRELMPASCAIAQAKGDLEWFITWQGSNLGGFCHEDEWIRVCPKIENSPPKCGQTRKAVSEQVRRAISAAIAIVLEQQKAA